MRNIIILFLGILFVFTSCIFDKFDERGITIKNKSKNEIYCFYLQNELNSDSIPKFNFPPKIIAPSGFDYESIGRPTWEDYIDKSNGKKIRYYIIKKDSVDKYGWKKIYEKNIYNRKYLFTLEDLEKINWEITYNDK